MVSADTTLWGSRKSLRRLDHRGESGPVSVQIVGTEPAKMAEAARRNIDMGAQIIDINMGCPAKKVCKVAAGSALMRDERLVGRILEAVVEAVDAPVTLKIRTGWDRENRNALAIGRIAGESGIQALAIHGRTRADKYAGDAEYDTIAAVTRQDMADFRTLARELDQGMGNVLAALERAGLAENTLVIYTSDHGESFG